MNEIKTIDKEKELVLRISRGDKEAFEELYNFYAPKIFRFIRLKVKSQTMAEDFTSESFLRIWEYLQRKVKLEQGFRALLYSIARNLIIDSYRRKSSQELSVDDDFMEFLSREPAKDEIKSKEQAQELHKVIMELKQEYQNVLIWYYIEDISVKEMGEIMNKSNGAIRVLIHRALGSLKKHLDKEQNRV